MAFAAHRIIGRTGLLSLLIFLGLLPWLYHRTLFAAGNLQNVSDIVSNSNPGAQDVEHEVSFTLPITAEQVVGTDYILIALDNFSSVTAATGMSGAYAGTPVYSVEDKTVKITGVSIIPGSTVKITGITADNPNVEPYMRITISICEDEDGLLIKNVGYTASSRTTGNIAVTATIAPPVAAVTISGYSAPGTFITFTENGTVIGTDTSGSSGYFSKYITGLAGGTHSFALYGVDQADLTTSIYNFDLTTPIYVETSYSNILLSPTISINDNDILQGDDIVAVGSSIPSGDISLFTEPQLRTYYATSSILGAWSYTIDDTADYLPGDYHVYTLVQNGSGLQSLFSNSLQFTVRSESSSGGAECDITEGDLSCDDSINLIDFSILMYYWGSTTAAADINGDGTVNLIDFSIMMYYWGT